MRASETSWIMTLAAVAMLVVDACAAGDGPIDRKPQHSGGTNTIGTTGTGTPSGSGGAAMPGGNVTGSGGSGSLGSAGTASQGGGGGISGSGGSAPAGSGGGAPVGAGGSGGSNGACSGVPDVGVAPSGAMINDMENGTAIQSTGTPGYWYTYNDMTVGATQMPPVNGTFNTAMISPARGASTYGVHTTGSGFTGWGAGMGFNFIGPKPSSVDGSKYKGITFFAKGAGNVRISLLTKATSPDGCVCSTQPKGCYDHFAAQKTFTTDWASYTVVWGDLAQQGYGAPATFDPKTLLAVNFQALNPSTTMPSPTPFSVDFWIDDIAFVP